MQATPTVSRPLADSTASSDNVTMRRRASDWKPSEDLDALKEAARMMDALSSSGFSRINGLARLALLALETPNGHRSVEPLAAALAAICEIADDTNIAINGEASSVCCGYRDEGWALRHDARLAFYDSQRKEVAA
jgi:hypothetical protein